MSPTRRTLEKFLSLSEAMSMAAKAEEWEDLVRAGEQRDTLLAHLTPELGVQRSPEEQVLVRGIIEHCQKLDEQTRSLVGDRQKALRVLLRENPLP